MFQAEFDSKEIQSALPDYKYIRRLGSGAFATVHLVEHRESGQLYALKKVSCFGMGDYQKNGAANQVRILSSLSHKNIIKVCSCLFDSSEDVLYILMEYAESGDLSNLIEQARDKKKRIPESTIWKIINDIADGLCYLHKSQIMHRDLKPANVFRMDRNFKIGDMNVSKVLKNGEAASTKTGSPYYTAPQVWEEDGPGYCFKCDVWSLGVLVYEMCSLQVPYEGDSIFQLINKIKSQKQQKNLPTFYSASLNELFKKMMELKPEKRISAQQILKISGEKLKLEVQGLDQKAVDNLMNTIVFPDTHQRWVNLIPFSLPPKTNRKEVSSSQIQQKTARSKSKSKQKTQSSEIRENHSGIFKSTERKPIVLPKSRSRSKIDKPNQQKPPQILPPLCKNSPQIPKKHPDPRLPKSRDKRQSSTGSRTNRKSALDSINEAKSIISSNQ